MCFFCVGQCEDFQKLRDAGVTEVRVLKQALFKRALATVPMRVYAQVQPPPSDLLCVGIVVLFFQGAWAADVKHWLVTSAQNEEGNVKRMYQNSMISPASWENFQACLEEVRSIHCTPTKLGNMS